MGSKVRKTTMKLEFFQSQNLDKLCFFDVGLSTNQIWWLCFSQSWVFDLGLSTSQIA